MAMLAVREALDFLLSAVRPVAEVEKIPTLEANGRVLASAVVSGMNVPGHDNTQMDGYAVRAADCTSGDATLAVTQRIPAGHVGQPLLPGCAARIFTGALIPEGADAVAAATGCGASLARGARRLRRRRRLEPKGECAGGASHALARAAQGRGDDPAATAA